MYFVRFVLFVVRDFNHEGHEGLEGKRDDKRTATKQMGRFQRPVIKKGRRLASLFRCGLETY
jgi:hypothetical protein